jgi:hydrogenase assembly chaperone HypC/HupF
MNVIVGFLSERPQKQCQTRNGFIPFVKMASQTYSYDIRNVLWDAVHVCLSFPGRIAEISGELATVDYGEDGVRKNVNVSLVEAKVGSYVLVQGGFAIRVLPEKEALETLETWKMVRELQTSSEEPQN